MLIIHELLKLKNEQLCLHLHFLYVHEILTNTEWINPVPPLSTKFSAFINHCMEVAEHKQYCLEFSLFAAHFQCLLVEVVKCLVYIRQHTRWWFVSDFDG